MRYTRTVVWQLPSSKPWQFASTAGLEDTPVVAVSSYDRTEPSEGTLREAAEDLLAEMPEVGDPLHPGWGRKASLQRFRSEAELRTYLRLLAELEESRKSYVWWWALALIGTVAGGIGLGLIWRKLRAKKARHKLTGLDVFAGCATAPAKAR
jgi:hypothetical protein